EWTEFEDWQKPGFKPRWFKLVAWTSCQNLIFRDVDESEYRNDRIIPDSDATFKDVEPGTKLVSISGGDSEVILFFDRRGHQREIWVKD
ncbi:MAG: hypothetical protein KGP14_10090, partial [Betaproteobacteria bacterium]|nr:hypothetical protein [Betaproteobacteria bacterium]